MKTLKSKYLLPLFLVVQILILQIISSFPKTVEYYYSNGFYPVVAQFSRASFSWFPFSIGDCIYFILIALLIKWFWDQRKTWRTSWKNNSLQLLSFFSLFYFLFHVLWALNYYRQPLYEKMGIKKEYTNDDLLDFTKKLIIKTNDIHQLITKNDDSKVVFPYTQESTFTKTLQGYAELSSHYDYFTFKKLSTKKSLLSLPLSYMGFSGYLNPFTNEAQVNYLIPMYGFPTTVNHEMAHQMGYASESECNFIGFLASINNKDLYFKYSGYSFALSYCLSSVRGQDELLYKTLLNDIHPGILKNFQESRDYRKKYQTPIQNGFHSFYDNFLKANQQKDGMDSYSKFVDLMINYYRTGSL